jgi:hypothetical protein
MKMLIKLQPERRVMQVNCYYISNKINDAI